MGFADFKTSMESRTGSVSSGSSSRLKGRTLKNSSFCPSSSSKLTQSIIKDHMVSHYRKIYSAKAAVDTSVPKSLLQSVKYNDQIRKERLRKGLRPESALSFSQRSGGTSCSSAQSQLSVQYSGSPYYLSRSSIISIPKFTTSFNTKDVVYPSSKVTSLHSRPSSEMKYRCPKGSQRKQSTSSLEDLRDQGGYKTFQDPFKKTYSGDLLQKHSQHFTREKPFTPKTLKSDKNSYLSKYRYYRAPQIKSPQEASSSGQMQETCEKSTKTGEITKQHDEPQEYSEHEWFDDQTNGTYLSEKLNSHIERNPCPFSSTSRILTEDMKSPSRSHISAEEEELLYLEFISAVTEDILSRGHFSDSVVNRVMKRHIDMNLHRLDEGKMRHLLEVLRQEFEQPTNTTSSSTEHQKTQNNLVDSVFLHLESGRKEVKREEDYDLPTHLSLTNNCDFTLADNSSLISTPLTSPLRSTSSTKIDERDKEEEHKDGIGSSLFSEDVPSHPDNNQDNFHQVAVTALNIHEEKNMHSTTNSEEKQADDQFDEQPKELEDLGNNLSEVLHVSNNSDDDF